VWLYTFLKPLCTVHSDGIPCREAKESGTCLDHPEHRNKTEDSAPVTVTEKRSNESRLISVSVAEKNVEVDKVSDDLEGEGQEESDEGSDENNEDFLYEMERMKLAKGIKKLLALKGESKYGFSWLVGWYL